MNSCVLKVYGERNTSTNYFSRLVALNLAITELPGVVPKYIVTAQKMFLGKEFIKDIYFLLTFNKNLGWKHSFVNVSDKKSLMYSNIFFLTISKNPYSWLLSLYRNPYHTKNNNIKDFKSFLQTPWKPLRRDNLSSIPETPIELWNLKNKSYIKLSELDGLNLTSEEIILEPEKTIDFISRHFDIPKKQGFFVNYEQSTKNLQCTSSYYRDYYLNEKWRQNLLKEEIHIINDSIDRDLMNYYGYEILS